MDNDKNIRNYGSKKYYIIIKITKKVHNIRSKISLGIPDIWLYLLSWILKLKINYENIFNEKLNIYDKVMVKSIDNIKWDIIYLVSKKMINLIIILIIILWNV